LQLILSTFGWGWHADCGLHFLRLYSGGVFDRFKNLKIILGHNGELVPFLLERTNAALNVMAPRDRTLKQVWDENIWVTTSGMFTLPPFYCLLKTTKIDRILYSVDYPFANNSDGVEFIRELSNSGLVTEEQIEMIAYRNAESLLNVKAQQE
jgi:predicted TIM-barrel fold metal-dependent hydrolase